MEAIESLEEYIRARFEKEGSGHDWWHIDRVRNVSLHLAREEKANRTVTEWAALLHDIADHKFHNNDLSIGPERAHNLVIEYSGDTKLAKLVADIVSQVSYKGAGVETPVSSLEAACVQDADRLDAMGAIGVARAFAYGGSQDRLLYHPGQPPRLHKAFEDYAKDDGHTINHFYEKLLLLKDRMQTQTGRLLAAERHSFMETFLEQFYAEWDGKA